MCTVSVYQLSGSLCARLCLSSSATALEVLESLPEEVGVKRCLMSLDPVLGGQTMSSQAKTG